MGARVLRKREERQGIYMKRKVISALLACTLLAGSAVPALAAGETAAGQTPAGIGAEAPALKVRQMGVLAVVRCGVGQSRRDIQRAGGHAREDPGDRNAGRGHEKGL